jgi:adenosylmethionine-8-amino-7-oxononanoate aminotransferase
MALRRADGREVIDASGGAAAAGGTLDWVRGDHLIVAPPCIVTAAELGTVVARLGAAADAALATL